MAMNAATMFGWWGLFTWIPSYLARPVDLGGAGLSIVRSSTWIIVMQVGMWCGYVSFGFIADAIGRKKSYVIYLVIAAALVPVYAMTRDVRWLLVLGPFLAFFGTGYFSGFGAVSAELFPTHLRATAQGLTYNAGRALSALAPVVVGALAVGRGLAWAFLVTSVAFVARRGAVDLDSGNERKNADVRARLRAPLRWVRLCLRRLLPPRALIDERHGKQHNADADEPEDAIDPAERRQIDQEDLQDGDPEERHRQITYRCEVAPHPDGDERAGAERPDEGQGQAAREAGVR